MKIDDLSIMQFGAHKGAKIVDVPASWLLWWWDDARGWDRPGLEREGNVSCGDHSKKHYEFRVALHDYIKEEFAALEQECTDRIITHRP